MIIAENRCLKLLPWFVLIFVSCTTNIPSTISIKQPSISPQSHSDPPTFEYQPSETRKTEEIEIEADHPNLVIAYTHHRPDGNRFIIGQGRLPDYHPFDIPLEDKPIWVIAAPTIEGSIWTVILENGTVVAFSLINGELKSIPITPQNIEPDTPPFLVIKDGSPYLLEIPFRDKSSLTHPILLPTSGHRVYISDIGKLNITDRQNRVIESLAVNAIPDARILVDDRERLLVLSDGTSHYDHGVLGDKIEATSITLVKTNPEIQVLQKIFIPPGKVVEGISPIWTDLTGDATREIIVTLSDQNQGAQIAIFEESGNLLALGPTIGQGYRWRHQIAVAPFGQNGELELVAVRTPHIGGIVEFYQLQENDLTISDQYDGFTSHIIGSRNLDMAAAGDFDGDGIVELLLPSQSLTTLGGIERVSSGVNQDWTLDIDGKMNTNLGVVTLKNDQILIGVGRQDGSLRLWIP